LIIIPAVDLKEGRCVRLSQGRMDQESVYSEHPVEMAKHWESKGAERLHIVDLNGAVTGKPIHRSLIKQITQSLRIPVEVGGGIREIATIEDYLSSGVRWVILGTAAFQNRSLVEEACRQFPERVILGIDAREGKVAIQGWNEVVSLEAVALAEQFEGAGLSAIIFTDIERDGMSTGLNFESTRRLSASTSIPVIASGGVSRIEDIEHLLEWESEGVIGVIVGRALYTEQLDLEEAIKLAKKAEGRRQKAE
ncbi:MAG: 1-(5-phosphoribosyl)-5-[(5-phosphoribosylamino)methylideneamino] imidazole-4-carboxamide isomerase, partial [Deltaproteobacteria bacterium]|jgi:phosphoribosylformimino-5-aminoimidazole carboxamide ribotide isomerase|nr:1-(5-phosphoribosyl)-5-[(5-phosphoribosylamino)methylideneamino] imidazole-4-carboxamide isomerase [Deltaproteobacteria bacterium]